MLDGGLALAVPTQLGQSMTIQYGQVAPRKMLWQSRDEAGEIWFEAFFDVSSLQFINGTDEAACKRLTTIFQQIRQIHPNFWSDKGGIRIQTTLEFPRAWGLGTSSTLINNLALWSETDPFLLLKNSFGGSGYDIACARTQSPILYQIRDQRPHYVEVNYYPEFIDHLYLVYLGKKMNSRTGIAHYRSKVHQPEAYIQSINKLVSKVIATRSLAEFESMVEAHEDLISETLDLPQAKELYFKDFEGTIKSLGAWGGDFVLATTRQSDVTVRQYFNERGFEVVLNFKELVKLSYD